MTRTLTAPAFIAGKALFLRRLTHSWGAALAKAEQYAAATDHPKAKPMWTATAAYIRATHGADL